MEDFVRWARVTAGCDRFADSDVVKQCYDFRGGDGRPVILGRRPGRRHAGEARPDLFDAVAATTSNAIDERLEAVRA